MHSLRNLINNFEENAIKLTKRNNITKIGDINVLQCHLVNHCGLFVNRTAVEQTELPCLAHI
jgi:hypothetical protein